MSAGVFNISVEQGALYEMNLTVATDATPGNEIDLTGYVFAGQIRYAPGLDTTLAVFQFQIQNQITNKGEVRVFMPSTVTAAIPVPSKIKGERGTIVAVYDIEYTPAAGDTYRLLQGTATVSAEVTR